MRELYKEVIIGGIYVPIWFDDEDEGIQEGALGLTDFAGDCVEIVLNPEIKNRPDLLQTTLWHELFHMISNIYSLDFDELDVSVLAVAVVDINEALKPKKRVRKSK